MKKIIFAITAATAACIASAQGLPKTVQGIDYPATLKATVPESKLRTSAYPEDPDDLGIPEGDFTFDMIESWAGEGENRAALVVQFNDTREKNALVFGYRWDGQATGADMIRAVVAANPRLYGLIQYTNVPSPTDPDGGYTINGFGWDLDDDGDIGLKDEKDGKIYTAEDGLFIHPHGYVPGQGGNPDYDYDDWKATDPDDLWGAGWYISYWSYWVKEGDSKNFAYSGLGASGRVLSNNSWDGWNFSLNMIPQDWKTFAAAPATIPDGAKTLFKNNGIYYTLKSYSSKTVSVCAPSEIEGETLGEYKGDIVIPASFTDDGLEYKVTSVGNAAFASSGITTVTLPASVTEIGDDAFTCTPLAKVIFAPDASPDQIKKIGERAFYSTAVTEALFSKKISVLPAAAFCDTHIEHVEIPAHITEIGEMCFALNSLLESVTVPASVKTIGASAFASSGEITKVRVETTVPPVITDDCFDESVYNTAVLTVPLGYPDTYAAAEGWKNFRNTAEYAMEVHEGDLFDMNGKSYRVTAVGESNEAVLTYKRVEGRPDRNSVSAANKAGYTGTVTVEPAVNYQNITFKITAMNDSTFFGAEALTQVSLPEGFTAVPDHSFEGCKALSKVNLPGTLESIGKYAFANSSALTEITLPDGLKSLGERAFYYCSALRSVNIPESLTTLPNYLFCYAGALESLEIPNSVNTLGTYLCDNCTSLKSVKLPEGITGLPNYMFNNCKALSRIEIPASVTSLGNAAFKGCASLKEIEIPQSVAELGTDVFNSCAAITEIKLPAAVKTLKGSLFYGCKSLVKITMSPEAVFSGTQIFRNCSSLEFISYYGDETSAESGVFKVSESTVSLPSYTFTDCKLMKRVVLPAGLKTLSSNALAQTPLTEIELPDGLTAIQSYAFASTKIGELVIPASVSSLSQGYICQKNDDVTFYICNPKPVSLGGQTFSKSGYNGPFFPVVVPTGTAGTYKNTANWNKSDISEPEITAINITLNKVDYISGSYMASGKVNIGYNLTALPAKFEAANTAGVLSALELTFEIDGNSRTAAAGTIKPEADGRFTIELENLKSSSAYTMSFTATFGDDSYIVAPVEFTTPVSSGIAGIAIDEDTPADFYSISGTLMASGINTAQARLTLPAGVYIARADGKTGKILIR